MDLIKTMLISALVVAGAYAMGKQREKYLNTLKEKKDGEDVVKAAKRAANLSDDDCAALNRMYDEWQKRKP